MSAVKAPNQILLVLSPREKVLWEVAYVAGVLRAQENVAIEDLGMGFMCSVECHGFNRGYEAGWSKKR